jgi:DNA-binding response OmpR family regulator
MEPPQVYWKDSFIKLTPSEFRLLSILVRRGSVPWSILEDVIPISADAGPTGVSVALSRIRKKLRDADAAAKDLILSVRGWGLRLAE